MIRRTEVIRIAPGSVEVDSLLRPLVSIILPTHNRAALLRRAINSVLAQTYQNFELFVVDDASTDETATVVQSITDSRIVYIRQQINRRAAAARNVAIERASGTLLAFMDDDDEWLIQKLERQVSALLRAPESIGLLLSGYVRITNSGMDYIGGQHHVRNFDYARKVVAANFPLIATPGWLLKKKVLMIAGTFDERLKSLDDWELGLRIADVTRIAVLDEPLWIQYQLRPKGSAMAANERLYGNDFDVIMAKHGHRWCSSVRAFHYNLAGRSEAMFGEVAKARQHFKSALRSSPWNLKSWVLLALTYGGSGTVNKSVYYWRRLRRGVRIIARGTALRNPQPGSKT